MFLAAYARVLEQMFSISYGKYIVLKILGFLWKHYVINNRIQFSYILSIDQVFTLLLEQNRLI